MFFIIIDDYYYGDYLLLLMIVLLLLMIICYCNKTNCSSSIYKVIRPVLSFFLSFLTIRFHKYKKALKSTKKHQKYWVFFKTNSSIKYFSMTFSWRFSIYIFLICLSSLHFCWYSFICCYSLLCWGICVSFSWCCCYLPSFGGCLCGRKMMLMMSFWTYN